MYIGGAEMSKLYTVKEIAEALQMDIETIRRYIYRKDLVAYKIGKEWRIKEEDFNKFIQKESNMEGDK